MEDNNNNEKLNNLFETNKRSDLKSLNNLTVIKISFILISVIVIIISFRLLAFYNDKTTQRQQLEAEIAELNTRKDELTYYISSPIDEYYIRKFAWEVYRLVPSDGHTYITDPTK